MGKIKRSLLIVSVSLFSLLIGGCKDHGGFAPLLSLFSTPVTQDMRENVDEFFELKLAVGDWHYRGTEISYDVVNAYIMIPDKLNMPTKDQRNYLQQRICPDSTNTRFWSKMKDVSLSVHIYTFTRQKTVNTECVNPLS